MKSEASVEDLARRLDLANAAVSDPVARMKAEEDPTFTPSKSRLPITIRAYFWD